MNPTESNTARPQTARVADVLDRFTRWLEGYGEASWDHQSYFAGSIGGRAKALYYRHKLLGTAAVAPMIFSEAFLPAARRLFHHPIRFPIADAHYAMGFAFLHQAGGEPAHLERAAHFLNELKKSRAPGFTEYCWGYPFNWVTRNGTIKEHTPFITTTPYVYEAFRQVHQLISLAPSAGGKATVRNADSLAPSAGERVGGRGVSPQSARSPESMVHRPLPSDLRPLASDFKAVMASIVRHVCTDIKDFPMSPTASSCGYDPGDRSGGVLNASAYRAGMLAYAARDFDCEEYWRIAERNLNFVLENQNADGSWYYAVDGVRDFVDHFHTCFVMKALAKIHTLTGHAATLAALERGVKYYLEHLFDADGLPKPFSRAPRLTVYKRELYDCAEAINLCLLLRDRFPQMGEKLEVVVAGILRDWITPAGSFRARQLKLGWDNVPMHRWAQSQMFRALAFYLRSLRGWSR